MRLIYLGRPRTPVMAQHSDLQADCDEDQDSGSSEVPPALRLIEPLGSRESIYQQREQQQELRRHEEFQQNAPSWQSLHHFSQHSMGMSDCGLQVSKEEIARTMDRPHLVMLTICPLCRASTWPAMRLARNQFDQLARLYEIFTSQLAMAEVTPVFRSCDAGSVYSEPAYRFITGLGSVCSEPPYRPPIPRTTFLFVLY
ncbi:kinesin-like protein GA13060 isoform X1 [Zeugodacus cucurbitae]|uniref:kinesin-like protein GA13060 isoform X1 n=1 Tax=Zeugodacus cucurbitae TaxID=28588 RepID=UPI0023D96407|nr:kinesin-like protein GA13060 isoform X1 [Zeugodacus cucurbitae]